jgi:ABC-type uncharacterized transport system permease subunit
MLSKGEMIGTLADAVAFVAAASSLRIAALDQAAIATTITVSAIAAQMILVISKFPFSDEIPEGGTDGQRMAGLIRLKATPRPHKAA